MLTPYGRRSEPRPRAALDLGTWVGSGTFELKAEKDGATHALAHKPGVRVADGNATVVRLKLFAAWGASDGYEVVTHAEGWKAYAGVDQYVAE